jgi:hypothetical protein
LGEIPLVASFSFPRQRLDREDKPFFPAIKAETIQRDNGKALVGNQGPEYMMKNEIE